MAEREARQNGTALPAQVEDKSNPSMQGAAKEPIKAEAPAKVAPQFDTGSTNLLEKFKNNDRLRVS